MEDFLKDRVVLTSADATIVVPAPAAAAPGAAFARIVRESGVGAGARPAVAPKPGVPAKPAPREPVHTSQVKPIVENGRVTRLVVTCSCGKVTEIACQY